MPRRIYRRYHSALKVHSGLLVIMLLVMLLLIPNARAEGQASYLQLRDNLDRPGDGYCVDILGTGNQLRVDQPLFAHNCSPGTGKPDATVVLREDGSLLFPVVDKCITVAGVNTTALPGAPLMLHSCGEGSLFVNAPALQKFEHRSDGRLQLRGSNLCLSVGDQSEQTYSANDRWRQLSMTDCEGSDPARATWMFTSPNK